LTVILQLTWQTVVVATTDKQSLRMPNSRWNAVTARAGAGNATGVVNALLEAYLAGELDTVVAVWLPRVIQDGRHVEHTGQVPSAASR
jgi:hypothetical protein